MMLLIVASRRIEQRPQHVRRTDALIIVGDQHDVKPAERRHETVHDRLVEDAADEWTFSGTAGDVVGILMTSLFIDTYLELYEPEGEILLEDGS